jgi:hypothetical protein
MVVQYTIFFIAACLYSTLLVQAYNLLSIFPAILLILEKTQQKQHRKKYE